MSAVLSCVDIPLGRVLDTLLTYVCVIALDGTVLDANRALLEATGTTVSAVRGTAFEACGWWAHDTAQLQRLRGTVVRAAAGEASRFNAEIRSLDDRRIVIDLQVAPLRDGEGRVTQLIASAADVTGQRDAEQALSVSEAAMEAFFEASPGILNIEDEEFRYVKTDRLTPTYFGLTRETIIGKAVAELAPQFIEQFGPMMRRVIETAEPQLNLEVQSPVPERPGEMSYWQASYFPVPLADGRRGIGVMGMDITELKNVQLALQDRSARLDLALQCAALGVYEVDLSRSAVRYDTRASAISGGVIPPDVWLPMRGPEFQRWLQDTHPDDVVRREENIAAMMDGTIDNYQLTFRVRRDPHAWRHLLASATILQRDKLSGLATRLVGVLADVTERREAEAALVRSNAQARLAAERVQLALAAGAIVGTWDWELPSDRFSVDERFADSFGLDPALGFHGLSLEQVIANVHPEDVAGLRAAIAEAVTRGGPYSHEYRVRARDGAYRWIEANGRVDLGPDGSPVRFPGVLLDVEGRRAIESERDRTAALLRAFIAAVPGVVYAKDREGRMLAANEGTVALVGKPLEAILGRTDAEFLDAPDQAVTVMANDRRIMESGAAEQVEETVSLPDGAPAVWLSTKAPFRNADGEVIGLLGVSVDITERKRAEDRLHLMFNELNHRVKNTLATVQSVVSQSLRGIDPGLRGALDARLVALAAAHDVLTREGWSGANFDEVLAEVLAPHGGVARGPFRLFGPPLRLAPRAAVALSMALHELATNALKYGALSVPCGTVEIRWQVDAGPAPSFRLVWTERNGPPVGEPARRGFGTKLLQRLLAQDLGGTPCLNFAPAGLVCSVDAPLAGLAAPADGARLPRVGWT